MESSSTFCISPSFNRNHSNDIADIADRVVQELRTENGLGDDDVFSFSDDDNPVEIGDDDAVNASNRTEMVKRNEEDAREDDEHDFEFPVVCRDSNSGNSSPVSNNDVISDDHISLTYPLFDRSLLSSKIDLNFSNGNGVDFPETDSKPAPRTRPSLRKLLSEEHDSPSTSSSESDDLDGIAPGTYCIWKPKTETETRGKHKKNNSISIGNTSKRWKVRDLLKRSFSDDNYSTGKDSPVLVFIPPVSPDQKTNNNEKVNKIEKTVGGGASSTKPEKKIPAYKSKIGNIRLPTYLPYRQDQVAAFAN